VTVQRGPEENPPADLAIQHIDLTVVPAEYRAWLLKYPRAINVAAIDISKRHVSENLVSARDGYQGPVLIKTNANAGGLKEARLARKTRFLTRRVVGSQAQRGGPRRRPGAYQILRSASQVPQAVWENPHLVVEKFLPERQGGFYCLRTWQFFGTAEINSLAFAKEPIVKARNAVRIEPVDVPEELRQIRERLGFDFGKFDYVMLDGRAVLFDANKTPTLGNFPPDRYLPLVRRLAAGLAKYLPASS
jgi:hypothetical protein